MLSPDLMVIEMLKRLTASSKGKIKKRNKEVADTNGGEKKENKIKLIGRSTEAGETEGVTGRKKK